MQQRSQGTSQIVSVESGLFRFVRGNSGFLSSHCRGIAPHLNLGGNLGFLSSGDGDLRVPLELQQGSQASSHVEAWNCGFLLSFKSIAKLPFELRQGTSFFSRVATGESFILCVLSGILEFHSNHFQFALIHRPNIPGSKAILLFTASDLASITSHIHSWVLFLLWLHPSFFLELFLH